MAHTIRRILLINYEYPPLGGGGGISSEILAREWAKDSEVHVLTSSFKDLPMFEKRDGVSIYRSRVFFRRFRDTATFISMISFLVSGFLKGISLMKRNEYTVINTHFAVPSGPLGMILGKLFKTKNILSLHGGDIFDPSKKLSPHRNVLFKVIVKCILHQADFIIAQSTNTKNNALEYYKINRYIHIIPLAFSRPDFAKKSRHEMHIKQHEFVVVSIGRLVKRKAFDDAIRTISEIQSDRIHLYIIGEGPERQYLQSVIREQNAGDRVTLVGYVNDNEKYNYLANADLMLMTSLHEGFGIIFQEAMHFGLPIVCTNNGGQLDLLKHEKNALLCNVGSVDECAESVDRLMKQRALYNRCSRNNKKDIKKYYSEEIAGQYMNLFMKVVFGETL